MNKGDVYGLSLITHLRAHETKANLVCRLLLEKKNMNTLVTHISAKDIMK